MRIAVITCDSYRDAWEPFVALLHRFWPGCPYPLAFHREQLAGESWCSVVARCANDAGSDPVLMMQEDFFLTAPVRGDLVERGRELLGLREAGCVRLYPSPGANLEIGDPQFGEIRRGTVNRISCQAAIWNPGYLGFIAKASMSTTGEAGDFENLGTPVSDESPMPVLAFKRDSGPWPMEYLASAITRGQWNPDAIRLCARYGIEIDRSRRTVLGGGDLDTAGRARRHR